MLRRFYIFSEMQYGFMDLNFNKNKRVLFGLKVFAIKLEMHNLY